LLRGLLGSRKAIRLLANGQFAQGRLTDNSISRARAKKPPVMKLTFEFTDALGQLQQAVVKTSQTEHLEDNPFETIFATRRIPKTRCCWIPCQVNKVSTAKVRSRQMASGACSLPFCFHFRNGCRCGHIPVENPAMKCKVKREPVR
jgi:hypothetical protein